MTNKRFVGVFKDSVNINKNIHRQCILSIYLLSIQRLPVLRKLKIYALKVIFKKQYFFSLTANLTYYPQRYSIQNYIKLHKNLSNPVLTGDGFKCQNYFHTFISSNTTFLSLANCSMLQYFFLFSQTNQQVQTKPNAISQWLVNNDSMLPMQF